MKEKFKIQLFLTMAFLAMANAVFAQVQGTVTDNSGVGLPGVNIIIKGTTTGTISDFNGNYQIEVDDIHHTTLVFNFIGFKKQEIAVNGRSEINVTLEEEVTLLNEVVAVGYGTQVKREVTSSISTISQPNDEGGSSIGEMLKGKAAGLQITNTDATPGASMRITVRGVNSINSGTDPLWIIDGIPVDSEQKNSNLRSGGVMDVFNPLAGLNADDIESIQVLKDAASTSIYGSRGANGVILVTTKQGKSGKAKIRVGYEQGISKAVNYKKYLNTSQHFEMLDEMAQNSGKDVSSWIPYFFSYADRETPKYSFYNRSYAEGVNNDWLDMILRVGHYKKVTASISGGQKGLKYYVSGYGKNNEGIMVGDERDDYGLSTNLAIDVTNKFKVKVNTKLHFNKFDYAQKAGSTASNQIGRENWGGRAGWRTVNRNSVPMIPIYTPDGEFFDPFGGYNPYPSIMESNQFNRGNEFKANVVLSLDYKLAKNLTFSAKGGLNNSYRTQLLYFSQDIRVKSIELKTGSARGIQNTNLRRLSTVNGYFNYKKELNDLKLEFMAGAEAYQKLDEIQMADYEDLQSQKISLGNTESATYIRGNYSKYSDRFSSFFGRINSTLKKKYMLGVTFRRDGSSVFSPKNRWGNFAAVSAGWIVSDESFMSGVDALNLLKFRTSYGSTGNASIPSFKWINTYSSWPEYGSTGGLVMSNIATDNLTWEKSYTFDLALDYGIFKNRISGSMGYYKTKTEDMLLNMPIAPSHGVYSNNSGPAALVNVGQMLNSGFEFNISTVNINTKKFTWKTSFNIATNLSKVGKLADGISSPLQIGYSPAFGSTLQLNSVWTGEKLGRFYIAEYAGLDEEGFETIYEIDQLKFRESNGLITEKTGNIIRATSENIQQNRIYHNNKTGLPTFFGGLSNSFTAYRFTLDINLAFSGGNYIYDQTVYYNGFVNSGRNPIDKRIYGKTFIPGIREDAKYPIQTYNNMDFDGKQLGTQHTKYLHKGDYLRLQKVGLSYDLPKKALKVIGVKYVKVYCTASNLFVWSPFKSFDPEFVNYGDIHAVTADRNLGQGYIKFDPFPKARTITVGAKLTF